MSTADRRAFLLVGLVGLYFAIMLFDHWWPAIGQTTFFLFYTLSVPLLLALLVVVAVAAGILRFRHGSSPTNATAARPLLIVSLGGLAAFVFVVAGSLLFARGLPTGSRVRKFDSAVWKDPKASEYVESDITARQKMLGDVVDNALSGRTRAEIEQLLGPSLDSPYFRESGRDLIYVTGPERDSMFAIDSEWLLIWLDDRGRFKRYEIATD